MIRNNHLWAAAVALAVTSSVHAHDSMSMIDITTSHWIKGTVVRCLPVSPHAMIELEENRERRNATLDRRRPVPGPPRAHSEP